ncbi:MULTISPECIES: CDGSH iron-sulfur domain-containing protein [Bacillus]|uniref:CDGSH iron-sulfur domain-containing protein n=1 Tax=Bacillus TaxID=1386 RepID=UPI0002E00954|nr:MULTISPECIES: CDGSH iron-sulfur domain-containing protein [Bacillus]
MSKVEIKVMDNGPLRVTGEFEVIDVDGNVFPTKSVVSLCRCGLSEKKPYCDGSHRGQFESTVRATLEENK